MAKKKQQKENRGRKSLEPGKKKVEVRFFIEQFIVDELGGIDETKEFAKTDLYERYEHCDISSIP